jgi:hypothetical protein
VETPRNLHGYQSGIFDDVQRLGEVIAAEASAPGQGATIMRFAKFTFIGAGFWGIVVLTPLYWLFDVTGRSYSPPTDYPQFFYGFLSVAMAWQIAFLVIGSNPARFRPMMIPSISEKLGHVVGVAVLYWNARISDVDAQAAVPDLLLAILFIVAFARTRASGQRNV